jgi:5'-nucleotidase (lipoprotein e(P4) family)
MNRSRFVTIVLLLSSMTLGCGQQRRQPSAAPDSTTTFRDTHELIQATLWVQTAAEYEALAGAAYRNAQHTLASALNDRSWTAVTEQSGAFQDLPPAVVLDLDETVLDNSAFQAQLVIDRTIYSPPRWTAWVKRRQATLIPGAKRFLEFAQSRSVKIFFVTNRRQRHGQDAADDEEAPTISNLRALGVEATGENVLCAGENGWTSDKTARRAAVAATHRILLLVGDDMNDFVSTAGMTVDERRALARSHEAKWGERWVLIPNPQYGSFESAAVALPGNTPDAVVLEKKRSLLRGIRE